MRVFVTGGSGFVGGHVIEALRSDGHEVHALARSPSSASRVAAFGATPVIGALGEIKPDAIRDCDAVVHAAAHVASWGPWEDFAQINIEGTRQLVAAARAAGVGRFVHIGTEAALFAGQDLVDVDESYPHPKRQRFAYSRSKAEAEKLVLAADDVAGMRTVVLRPRLVWGPRDASVGAAVERMGKDGTWIWLDGGRHRTSTCHVDNLCSAVGAALAADTGGRTYFIADDGERSLRQFLSAIAAARGLSLPDRSVPGWVARTVAAVLDIAWRTIGRVTPPPLVPFEISMMSASITVRTGRARAELGWRPVRTVADGLEALRTGPVHNPHERP
ncbi:MAG: NAD-dependent epimerase/dehydratase family protein [Deltaproteobacteria bacterium]|nr:NAD-dependent epimerase/dehydratase family protein [Deltaproteobacteria bacterium]